LYDFVFSATGIDAKKSDTSAEKTRCRSTKPNRLEGLKLHEDDTCKSYPPTIPNAIFCGVCAVPLLDERAVNEAVQFDLSFNSAPMTTLLDTLIIDALRIGLNRLHKDHVRDVIIGAIFAARRASGMSPSQIVFYLEKSAT